MNRKIAFRKVLPFAAGLTVSILLTVLVWFCVLRKGSRVDVEQMEGHNTMSLPSRSWYRIPKGYHLDTIPYSSAIGRLVISGTDSGDAIVITRTPGVPDGFCTERQIYPGFTGFGQTFRYGYGIAAVRDCELHGAKKGYNVFGGISFIDVRNFSLCDAVYAIDVPTRKMLRGKTDSMELKSSSR